MNLPISLPANPQLSPSAKEARLLKPQQKRIDLATAKNSLSRSYNDYLSAALVTVDNKGMPNKEIPGVFLLNPESWNENKTAHWIQHIIPGQSDPILQWISSGPRTVTFDALITKDTANPFKPVVTTKPAITNIIAKIASKIFNAPIPNIADTNGTSSNKNLKGDLLDISDYLNYYRSLLYPIYSNNTLQSSPPLVILVTGSTFEDNPQVTASITVKSTVWVVTNLKINITKQLPNLAPMEAMVNFELIQYTLLPFDQNMFVY